MTASAKAAAEAKAVADQAKQALADAQARKDALANPTPAKKRFLYGGDHN